MTSDDSRHSAAAARRPATPGGRLLRGLGLAARITLVLGPVLALLRTLRYADQRLLVAPAFLDISLPQAGLFAVAATAIGGAIFPLLARVVPSVRLRATLAALPGWVGFSLVVGWLTNRYYLPRVTDPVSLAGNGVLVLLLLGLLVAVGWWIARWQGRLAEGSRREGLGWVAALVVLSAVVIGWGRVAEVESRDRPNVIVVLIDVLRADHLGTYGYERDTSPNIDRFARDAVVFDQAVAQSTFTKTSVASILTGLYPHRHGVYIAANFDDPTQRNVQADTLGQHLSTLGERLQADDVLTAAWVQNGQLRAYMGFDQGFSLYRDQPGHMPVILEEFASWYPPFRGRIPFFTYLHILDLHGPYLPQPPWDTRFGRYSDRFDDIDMDNWRVYRNGVRQGEIEPSDAEIRQLEALYDGQLAWVDDQFGRAMDELKASGLYDDSMIIFTGDHGDAFMEHGFISHSHTPYEELIRVPLIVKFPRSRYAGLRIDDQVALVDVAPTVLRFLRADGWEEMDGTTLLTYVDNASEGRPPAPFERRIISEHRDTLAVRSQDWKYIVHPDAPAELYDLASDPGEQVNLFAERPDIVAELAPLAELAIEARGRLGATEQVEVDSDTVEQLRALGYLDP